MRAAVDGRLRDAGVDGRQRPLLQDGHVRRDGVERIRTHRLKAHAEDHLHRVLPFRCHPHRLCEPGRGRDPSGLEPFGRHARTGSERLPLQRLEGGGTAAMHPEELADVIERPGSRLNGAPQPPYRLLRSRLLHLRPLQLPLHRLDTKTNRLCLSLQRAEVDRGALFLQLTRPCFELLDARFEMLDAGLLRMHVPRRLPFALDQGIELRLQGVYVVLDLAELSMRARRSIVQLRQCRPVEGNLAGEVFAPRVLAAGSEASSHPGARSPDAGLRQAPPGAAAVNEWTPRPERPRPRHRVRHDNAGCRPRSRRCVLPAPLSSSASMRRCSASAASSRVR